MPLTSLLVLGLTILVASFISGTFGMAGGMILLGQLDRGIRHRAAALVGVEHVLLHGGEPGRELRARIARMRTL